MKRLLVAVAVVLAAAGCSDDDNPGSPTTNPNQVRFLSEMNTANEIPTPTAAEQGANGNTNITFNLTRDANGGITAANVTFEIAVRGFPAGSTVTAAHIHPGRAGSTGGVLVSAGLSSGELALTNGAGNITKANLNLTVDQANQIMADPSAFYFNVHTVANGAGVMRGQLVRQ